MRKIVDFIDHVSRAIGAWSMVLIVALVAIVVFEVVMRRFLNAPTLWAFDVSYMLNGAIFLGAAGYALLNDAHVKVTFLSDRLPTRTRLIVNGVFYLSLFAPVVGLLSFVAIREAYTAYATGTTERVSPWAPMIWPFYSGLAIGVFGLWLQGVAQGLKCVASLRGRGAR